MTASADKTARRADKLQKKAAKQLARQQKNAALTQKKAGQQPPGELCHVTLTSEGGLPCQQTAQVPHIAHGLPCCLHILAHHSILASSSSAHALNVQAHAAGFWQNPISYLFYFWYTPLLWLVSPSMCVVPLAACLCLLVCFTRPINDAHRATSGQYSGRMSLRCRTTWKQTKFILSSSPNGGDCLQQQRPRPRCGLPQLSPDLNQCCLFCPECTKMTVLDIPCCVRQQSGRYSRQRDGLLCGPVTDWTRHAGAQGREKLERTRNGKIAAFLWKTLWARHKGTLMASLALQGVYSAFNFAGPVILNKIVTFLQNWALWKAEQNAPLVRLSSVKHVCHHANVYKADVLARCAACHTPQAGVESTGLPSCMLHACQCCGQVRASQLQQMGLKVDM